MDVSYDVLESSLQKPLLLESVSQGAVMETRSMLGWQRRW